MSKLYSLFRTSLDQYFVYRLNFILWRVRGIFNLLLLFFLWSGIFSGKTQVIGYQKEEIFTYVLLSNIISNIVFSTKTPEFASEILDGKIINFLLKPVHLFSVIISREAADKALNTVFSCLEVVVLFLIFRPPVHIQTDPVTLIVFLLAVANAIILSFLISFCLSCIAFWSAEIWGPRFVYFVLVTLLSGSWFPLDIFPAPLYQILLFSPFGQLMYLPTKIFLSGIQPIYFHALTIGLLWTIGFYFFSMFLLKKGFREFSFFGR